MSAVWNLENKIALVTGGTQGIGRAVVFEMASLGAKVLAVGRTQSKLESLAVESKKRKLEVRTLAADVASPEGRKKIVESVQSLGGLDILVNNVGSSERKSLEESTDSDFRSQLEVNFLGNVSLTRDLVRYLEKSQTQAIINVTSVAGLVGMPSRSMYGSAKAAFEASTKYLASELGSRWIRVNSVAPWFTRNSMTESTLANQEFVKVIEAATPLGRVAEAQEVAHAVTFLALPASSYITGITLTVDGGFLARGL